MIIAGVCCTRNERDVIWLVIRHMLAQVDKVYVYDESDDKVTTAALLEMDEMYPQLTVYVDSTTRYFRQPELCTGMATRAAAEGAEWIVPFDASEFWVTPGSTMRALFARLGSGKIYAEVYEQLDWERKAQPQGPPKAAFRWEPGAQIGWGGHDTYLPASNDRVYRGESEGLEVRRLQYRGFNHFCIKTLDHSDRTSPPEKATGIGWHNSRLDGFSREQMAAEWAILQARPTVYDPLPVLGTSPLPSYEELVAMWPGTARVEVPS